MSYLQRVPRGACIARRAGGPLCALFRWVHTSDESPSTWRVYTGAPPALAHGASRAAVWGLGPLHGAKADTRRLSPCACHPATLPQTYTCGRIGAPLALRAARREICSLGGAPKGCFLHHPAACGLARPLRAHIHAHTWRIFGEAKRRQRGTNAPGGALHGRIRTCWRVCTAGTILAQFLVARTDPRAAERGRGARILSVHTHMHTRARLLARALPKHLCAHLLGESLA